MLSKQKCLFLQVIAILLLAMSFGLVVDDGELSKKFRLQKEKAKQDQEIVRSSRNRKSRQSREPQGRSLEVLLAEIKDLGMRIDAPIERVLVSQKACDNFAANLTAQEVLALAKYFRSESSQDLDLTLRPLVMKRWGKLHPIAALKITSGYGFLDFEDSASIYKGWAEMQPMKALEKFREDETFEVNVFNIEKTLTRSLQNSLRNSVSSKLYHELAKKDINIALKELAFIKEDEFFLARIPLIASRDAVYEHFPRGSPWLEIAEQNLDRTFTDIKEFDAREAGAGPIFYAKWLEESPIEASAWIRKSDSEQLTRAWSHRLMLDVTDARKSNVEAHQILTEEEFNDVKSQMTERTWLPSE